jgi:ribosome biogenesis GTPase
MDANSLEPALPASDPRKDITLHDLGWDLVDETSREYHLDPDLRVARVTHQGRGAWRVHDGYEERIVRARSRAMTVLPVTGDWVAIREDGGSWYVDGVLPRRTVLSRNESGTRTQEQVIAANVDVVAICTPADAVNLRRLERELTAVWSSGATPVVIVTKADLAPDPESVVSDVRSVCLGVDVLAVSTWWGDGVERVRGILPAGATMALIGPSGVGKSSLVNALAGREELATTAVRSDGKGRHTTTSRHLVVLPGGGLLLDTPGMREFAPWADDDALAGTFPDIEALAEDCRFSDCGHEHEPGCAVLAAADVDEQMAARLANWRALQRELAWLERRNDARLQREERRKWAAISKSMRGSPTIRH